MTPIKTLFTTLSLLLLLIGCNRSVSAETPTTSSSSQTTAANSSSSTQSLQGPADSLFALKAMDAPILTQGVVIQLLADDTVGDKHQRFILKTPSGLTLLFAHNIDIATRVQPLNIGDSLSAKGEYIWNSQGGIVHWTHKDPDGSHPNGWIQRGTVVFE